MADKKQPTVIVIMKDKYDPYCPLFGWSKRKHINVIWCPEQYTTELDMQQFLKDAYTKAVEDHLDFLVVRTEYSVPVHCLRLMVKNKEISVENFKLYYKGKLFLVDSDGRFPEWPSGKFLSAYGDVLLGLL